MARDIRDRVLIVTGASSGIGAATALAAAEAGMKVVLAARRRAKLEDVARRVESRGGEALVAPTDVGEPSQVEALFAAALARFGRVDALFANAGFGFMQRAASDAMSDVERRMWATNFHGVVACCREAARVMRRQGGGHILICSSIVGRIGLPYYSGYASTKAALHAFAASLSLELEPDRIAVSCVYPVGTRTEFFAVSKAISGRDGISENTPAMFIQSSEHVARRVVACLRRPRPEVWPSVGGRLAALLWNASPRAHRFCFRFHARWCRRTLEPESDRGSPTGGPIESPVTVKVKDRGPTGGGGDER